MAEISLELLQVMLQRVLDGLGGLRQDMSEVKDRVLSVERALVGMRREQAGDAEYVAGVHGPPHEPGRPDRTPTRSG